MTLTFIQGHWVTRKLELAQPFSCIAVRSSQTLAIDDYVGEMTAKKSCKAGEYGLFER